MHSHLVLLLLVVTVVLVNAKNIHQIEDESNDSEEQKRTLHSDHVHHQPPLVQELLMKYLAGELNIQRVNDRIQHIAKRAKAIIKGDPREFMG